MLTLITEYPRVSSVIQCVSNKKQDLIHCGCNGLY